MHVATYNYQHASKQGQEIVYQDHIHEEKIYLPLKPNLVHVKDLLQVDLALPEVDHELQNIYFIPMILNLVHKNDHHTQFNHHYYINH